MRLAGLGTVVLMVGVSARSAHDARVAEGRWGRSVEVVVAGAAAAAGTELRTARPIHEARPEAMVVDDALRELPADGDRLRFPIEVGEVVTRRHLVSEPRRLSDDVRALAVPVGAGSPRLEEGDAVDVVVVLDPFGAPAPAVDELVPATVLTANAAEVTVAVSVEQVLTIVRALAHGEVTLVRR